MKCTINGATISTCGLYRTRLWRIWDDELPRALFICLNPSEANASRSDPSLQRMIGFAKREGCGGVEVVNIYSYRSKSPRAMWDASGDIDIKGPDNHMTLVAMIRAVDGPIICGWGAQCGPEAEELVRALAGDKPLFHLGLNKDGTPKHPLYIKGDTPLTEWLTPGEVAMLDEDEQDDFADVIGPVAADYAHKPRQALAVFETPHDSVIEEVIADAKHKRNGGFTRAMVVVK